MLHSNHLGRERILCYGTTGTSKTHSWLNIAKWSQRTNSPAQFHVLDTDNAVIDQLEEGYPELTNVTVYPTFDYTDYTKNLSTINKLVTPDDWIVGDMAGDFWDACQRHFSEQIFNHDIETHFMAMRKAMQEFNDKQRSDSDKKKRFNPLEGFVDWPTINKLNKGWMDSFALRNRCHIFATSKADKLNEQDEAENADVYGRFGYKPHGQKFLGHYFRTILLTQKVGKDWVINSVKDRERELLVGEKVKEFTLSYLKGVGGWSI